MEYLLKRLATIALLRFGVGSASFLPSSSPSPSSSESAMTCTNQRRHTRCNNKHGKKGNNAQPRQCPACFYLLYSIVHCLAALKLERTRFLLSAPPYPYLCQLCSRTFSPDLQSVVTINCSTKYHLQERFINSVHDAYVYNQLYNTFLPTLVYQYAVEPFVCTTSRQATAKTFSRSAGSPALSPSPRRAVAAPPLRPRACVFCSLRLERHGAPPRPVALEPAPLSAESRPKGRAGTRLRTYSI